MYTGQVSTPPGGLSLTVSCCHPGSDCQLLQHKIEKHFSFCKKDDHVDMFQHQNAVDSIAMCLGNATEVKNLFQGIWL